MKVAIGADHAGFRLKTHLASWLQLQGHDVLDLGTSDESSVDYPDYGAAVGRAVTAGLAEKGIVVCGSGIGISMAANKVPGIRAALCSEPVSARLSREHNDANVLALGERLTTFLMAEEILQVWLSTEFVGGRHQGRIAKLAALEIENNSNESHLA